MDRITNITLNDYPVITTAEGETVIDDPSLPGLSLAVFEKLRPFLWCHRLTKSGKFTGMPKWSVGQPKDFRQLTYVEVAQWRGCNPGTHHEVNSKGQNEHRFDGPARTYSTTKQQRRIGSKLRQWFRERWFEFLNAISPQGEC